MAFAFKGLKGFAADAATALNRAVQFTEERLGHSERTELDGYFENLLTRAEQIKCWTEKLVASAESVLQPNPGQRVEDYLIEKLAVNTAEKRKERMRNLEWLGSNMISAGQDLTPGDIYGNALIKSGQTQLKLGQYEREFASKADRDFVKPLKKFLDEEAKALGREKRTLEAKRLDLDAAKNKFKKIKSTDESQSSNQPLDQVVKELDETEKELKRAQEEFDKQIELVTEICNSIIKSNEQHVKCLSKFIEAQAEYYELANKHLNDLLNDRVDENASSNSAQNTGFATLLSGSGPDD